MGETRAPKHGRDLSPPETHSSKRLLKPNWAKNMEIRCLQGDDTYNFNCDVATRDSPAQTEELTLKAV